MIIQDLLTREYNEALKKSYEDLFFDITRRKQTLPLCNSRESPIILQWKKEIIDKFLKGLEEGLTTNRREILKDINACYKSQKGFLKSEKVHYQCTSSVFLYLTVKGERNNEY